MSRPLTVLRFSWRLVKYEAGLQLQEQLVQQLRAGARHDTLVLLQHAPVYTLGKRGNSQDFRVPMQELQQQGIDVHHVPRGGQVTYHGPGQLVAYPIVSLRGAGRGARAWVEGLEDVLIKTIGEYGVHAHGRVAGATGVWVEDRKIAAIGVKISHGISSHGIALNIDTDLSAYNVIVPCGIEDRSMTSLRQELTRSHLQGTAAAHLQMQQGLVAAASSVQHEPSSSSVLITPQQAHTSVPAVGLPVGMSKAGAKIAGIVAGPNKLPKRQGAAFRHVADTFMHAFCDKFGYEVPESRISQHVQDVGGISRHVSSHEVSRNSDKNSDNSHDSENHWMWGDGDGDGWGGGDGGGGDGGGSD